MPLPAVHKKSGRKLFRAENRILQRLGRREAKPRTRRNLDLLTSRRITPHARLGLALAEDAEAGQPQRSFFLQFANDQRVEFLEYGLALLLREFELFSQVGCYLRLSHPSSSLRTGLRAFSEGERVARKFQERMR